MRSSALLLASLLAGTASPHAVATPTSLTSTMQAAADNTRVQAARWRAQAADATARAAWRGSWAPSLDLQAQAARRDQLSTIDTPAGAFTLGDRDVYEATLSLRQPLLDLSNQAYGAPASQRVAQAQHQQVLRQQRVQAAAAASHYLDWLALEAQRQAILSLQDSLQLRAARVRNQSTAGRALQADVLDMDVAVTEARQQLVEIKAQQTVLRQDLTRLTGRPIQPQDVRPPDNAADHLQMPDWAKVFAQRRDLQALRLQRESQRLLASAERASAWPTLGAAVSVVRSQGNPFTPEDDVRVGLNLQWQPFTSGRIQAQRQAAESHSSALDADIQQLQAAIRVEIAQAQASIRTAISLAELAQSAVAASKASRQVRVARYEAGRATVDEVLDAEATYARQRAQAASAGYRLRSAVIEHRLATGAPLFTDTAAD